MVRLRPELNGAQRPEQATKIAVRGLARRCQALNEEIAAVEVQLSRLTLAAAPRLLARPGIGIDTAAQLLITAGDNPDRLRSEAAFARLVGVAPTCLVRSDRPTPTQPRRGPAGQPSPAHDCTGTAPP
jgi:transposase